MELLQIEKFKYSIVVAYLSPLFTQERLASKTLLNVVGEPLQGFICGRKSRKKEIIINEDIAKYYLISGLRFIFNSYSKISKISKMEDSSNKTTQEYQSTSFVLDDALHARPSASLVKLAVDYSNKGCRIYMHTKRMNGMTLPENYALWHNEKKYLKITSILYTMLVAAHKGETLEFITSGPLAAEALAGIQGLARTFKKKKEEPALVF